MEKKTSVIIGGRIALGNIFPLITKSRESNQKGRPGEKGSARLPAGRQGNQLSSPSVLLKLLICSAKRPHLKIRETWTGEPSRQKGPRRQVMVGKPVKRR